MQLDSNVLASQLEGIADRLHQPASTRIWEVIRLIRAASASVERHEAPRDGEESEALALAMQEGSFAVGAFDALTAEPPIANAEDFMRNALGDGFGERTSPEDALDKDCLRALFLAGLFSRGGFRPSVDKSFTGVAVDGCRLGAVAMRPGSHHTFADEMRQAVDTVAQHTEEGRIDCGFVAIDLNAVMQRDDPTECFSLPAACDRDDEFHRSLALLARSFVMGAVGLIERCRGARQVVGVTALQMPVLLDLAHRKVTLVRSFTTAHLRHGRRLVPWLDAFGQLARLWAADETTLQ